MINPPITAIANGWCNSEPVPMPMASGSNAMIAPIAVISFGQPGSRNRNERNSK